MSGEEILKEVLSIQLNTLVLLLGIVVPLVDSEYNNDYILFYNDNNQIKYLIFIIYKPKNIYHSKVILEKVICISLN